MLNKLDDLTPEQREREFANEMHSLGMALSPTPLLCGKGDRVRLTHLVGSQGQTAGFKREPHYCAIRLSKPIPYDEASGLHAGIGRELKVVNNHRCTTPDDEVYMEQPCSHGVTEYHAYSMTALRCFKRIFRQLFGEETDHQEDYTLTAHLFEQEHFLNELAQKANSPPEPERNYGDPFPYTPWGTLK